MISFKKQIIVCLFVASVVSITGYYLYFNMNNSNKMANDKKIANIFEGCKLNNLRDSLVGKPFPKYNYLDIYDKDSYKDLSEGKVLVVFFRSSCPACLQEFVEIERQYEKISQHLKVVGVTDESKGIIKNFIDTKQPKFDIYFDVDGGLMFQTRVTCTPTQFLLKNGIIENITVGKIKDYQTMEMDL